jgi:hypothetical protein
MTGPPEETAAGRGRLRASHADREQVIGTLKAAFVQGRLAKDEFDLRVGQTLAARTYRELAVLTADLPAGPAAAPPPGRPAGARAYPPVGQAVLVGTGVGILPVILMAALLTGSDVLGKVFLLMAPWYLMAWIVAGAQMAANWHDQRSRGQLPPRPGQRGRAPGGGQRSRPGDDLIRCVSA